MGGYTPKRIGQGGLPDFAARLAGALRLIVPNTFTLVFGYRGTARPLDQYDDFPDAHRKVFVTDYQAGPHLRDPFSQAATKPVAPDP